MKYKKLLLISAIILTSCSTAKPKEKTNIQEAKIPDVEHEYFEIEYKIINWEYILEQNIKTYYVYVYSLTCSHCQELKNWIIEKALDRNDIFFVKGTNKIKIQNDVSSTIGATSVESISILGYPSLLKIDNKTITKNVAGNSKIINLLS